LAYTRLKKHFDLWSKRLADTDLIFMEIKKCGAIYIGVTINAVVWAHLTKAFLILFGYIGSYYY